MFSREEAEKLKQECARELRKRGHKTPKSHLRHTKRKRFAKPDDSKIREITSKITYWEWVDNHTNKYGQRGSQGSSEYREPLEANPDLFDDNPNNTVD